MAGPWEKFKDDRPGPWTKFKKEDRPDQTWGEWLVSPKTGEEKTTQSFGNWLLGRDLPQHKIDETAAWNERNIEANRPRTQAELDVNPSGAENMLQAMTFQRGDNIARMLGQDEFADRLTSRSEQFKKNHPWGGTAYDAIGSGMVAATGAQALGAVAPGLSSLFNPLGKTLPVQMAQGGVTAGGMEALWQSGDERNTWGDVARKTRNATIGGAAMPVAMRGLEKVAGGAQKILARKMARKLSAQNPPRSVGELKSLAAPQYKAIRDSQTVIKPEAVKSLKEKILGSVDIDETNTLLLPKTIGLKKHIERTLEDGDFEKLHNLSMTMNGELRGMSKDTADYTNVKAMKQVLTDFFDDGIDPSIVQSGSEDVGKLLRDTDKLWARTAKLEMAETVANNINLKTGQFSQSGEANAVQSAARQLYRRITKNLSGRTSSRGWSKDEIAMVKELAEGGDAGKLLTWMARQAPKGGLSATLNVMMFGGSTGVGSAIGGPVGAGVGAAGSAAYSGATLLASREKDKRARLAFENLLRKLANDKAIQPAYRPVNIGAVARTGLTTGANRYNEPVLGEILNPGGPR